MTRYEEQYYNDIHRIANNTDKLVKYLDPTIIVPEPEKLDDKKIKELLNNQVTTCLTEPDVKFTTSFLDTAKANALIQELAKYKSAIQVLKRYIRLGNYLDGTPYISMRDGNNCISLDTYEKDSDLLEEVFKWNMWELKMEYMI